MTICLSIEISLGYPLSFHLHVLCIHAFVLYIIILWCTNCRGWTKGATCKGNFKGLEFWYLFRILCFHLDFCSFWLSP